MIKKTPETTCRYKIAYICDVCGRECQDYMHACEICEKHVCGKCWVLDYSPCGDCPDHYCQACWGAGGKYRVAMMEAEIRRDKTIDRLQKDWREAALKVKR